MTKRLAKEEGIFAGMSSGGSVTAALKLIGKLDKGVVVAIICTEVIGIYRLIFSFKWHKNIIFRY